MSIAPRNKPSPRRRAKWPGSERRSSFTGAALQPLRRRRSIRHSFDRHYVEVVLSGMSIDQFNRRGAGALAGGTLAFPAGIGDH